MQLVLDREKYKAVARQAAAEGCVLLRNDNQTLPLKKNDKVAVFGRCAFNYYKSGLGSGGLVNTRYVTGILDALKECQDIQLNEELLHIYEEWIKENPIDKGKGWGSVPWSQKEMPVTEEMEAIAGETDVAIVIVGRTAGEDQDNTDDPGSYKLTETEYDMIKKVSAACKRTAVLLNVGNIIDTTWVEELNPAALMYVWQGGQEGGNGVADVLTGKVNPSGKLTDTIAYELKSYPSADNFGDEHKTYYKEDIYVGYRYFETFAKDSVLYPFGYGISYTSFQVSEAGIAETENEVKLTAKVTNTGNAAGKEVVFFYVKQPQGALGKPERVLVGFDKTKELQPQESVQIEVTVKKSEYASYDETGKAGAKSAYVLEEGEYIFYVGGDVKNVTECGRYFQKFKVVEQLSQQCAPIEEFERLVCKEENGKLVKAYEISPQRERNPIEKIEAGRKPAIPYIGNKGYKLADVYNKKVTIEEFVAQFSERDLMGIFYGEGMCSHKVTPGTAGAFGGVTDNLRAFGIPVACCADGPSGIRMDCGTKAFSLPNGTAIACSFNLQLARELFEMVGTEMRLQKVDTLLGPGINIHRHPLNGRNFEYFSEDPIVTGKMCAAQVEGLGAAGVYGTIKHFCCNNQEHHRHLVEAVVSERALREIYLKGFEIAVKEGNAKSIMTSYSPTNGIWAAGNYELLTEILRKEWNYDGIVMTDWWANANWEGEPSVRENRAPIVRAQNDLYMCSDDADAQIDKDNVPEMFEKGVVTTYDLQRNCINILNFILKTPAMLRELGIDDEVIAEGGEDECDEDIWLQDMTTYNADSETREVIIDKPVMGEAGKSVLYELFLAHGGMYEMEMEITSALGELAQLPITVFVDNDYLTTISFVGTNGASASKTCQMGPFFGPIHYIKLTFGADAIELSKIKITPLGDS